MKTLFLTVILIFLSSCSSIHKTFVDPAEKDQKVFAGTKNNIEWVSNPPSQEKIYPYTVMGLIDFLPSVGIDIILLPYTLYEKYSK